MTRLSARWTSLTLFKSLADASMIKISWSSHHMGQEAYDEQKTCPHFVTLIVDEGHKHTGHVCFTVTFGVGWRCKRFLRFCKVVLENVKVERMMKPTKIAMPTSTRDIGACSSTFSRAIGSSRFSSSCCWRASSSSHPSARFSRSPSS